MSGLSRFVTVLRRLGRTLDASILELVGLALLLAGAVAATGVVWLSSVSSPVGPDAERRPVPTAPGATGGPAGGRPSAGMTTIAPPGDITVHVAGAVAEAGLVTLAPGARVADAVAAAGGADADATLGRINLARELADGEQILVPTRRPSARSPGAPGTGTPGAGSGLAVGPAGRVSLNRATASDLESLPGIGPVLAERIIEWRDDNGPVRDVAELVEVAGIGQRTVENLAEHVRP